MPSLAATFRQARAQWQRLSLRERRLILAATATAATLAALVVGLLVAGGLSDLAERNRALAEAIADLDAHRDEYRRARDEESRSLVRIRSAAPALQGFLEAAARESNITIPESNERQPQKHGKRFVEKSVELKLRGVGLSDLAGFLRRIETAPHLVAVTRLSVRTRYNEHASLDVEMTVSTWELASPGRPQPALAGGKT